MKQRNFLLDISSAVTLHWLLALCQFAQPNTNPRMPSSVR